MIRPMPDRPIGLTEPSRARGLPVMVVAAGLLLSAPVGRAADLYSGDGFDLRWDNTLRYSAAARLGSADPMLLSRLNADDGDRNFAPGLISKPARPAVRGRSVQGRFRRPGQRRGLVRHGLSCAYGQSFALDQQRRLGARHAIRACGPQSPGPGRRPRRHLRLRQLRGQRRAGLAADRPAERAVGRESFFRRKQHRCRPGARRLHQECRHAEGYSNDAFLPVDQISLSVQPRAGITLAAYYQFGWRGSAWRASAAISATRIWWGLALNACCCRGASFFITARTRRRRATTSSAFRCTRRSTIWISVSTR